MRIRDYRGTDLPVLKEITVEAFDGASMDQIIERRYGLLNDGDWKSRKARHIDVDAARETGCIFVAEAEGEIVGYVTTWTDSLAGIGHIPNIAVAAGYRGQGTGRWLIERALGHFRSMGMTHARIETLAENEVGYHLYTSIGFQELARQVHFIMPLEPQSS